MFIGLLENCLFGVIAQKSSSISFLCQHDFHLIVAGPRLGVQLSQPDIGIV